MRQPTLKDVPAIVTLLAESGLPTDDVYEQNLSFFRIELSVDGLSAVGGLEPCGNVALIRSVATAESMRGRGIADNIVRELEKHAVSEGFDSLYLLTETAEHYFKSRGYTQIERSNVPLTVKNSRQFSSLCPGTAIAMFKRVGV